jgi:hypothetical protein
MKSYNRVSQTTERIPELEQRSFEISPIRKKKTKQ